MMKHDKSGSESLIQLALDLESVEEAVDMARAVEGQIDLVEIGTPLIKKFGVDAISKMSRKIRKPIVADMKTLDGGSYEAEIAFDAGADYVVVMGMADKATIWNVANVARKYRKSFIVDFLGIVQPRQKLLFINEFGRNAILLSHLAFDSKIVGRGQYHLRRISQYRRFFGGKIAVAGKISESNASAIGKARADIYVVGSAIYKAKDPRAAAENIRAALGLSSKS